MPAQKSAAALKLWAAALPAVTQPMYCWMLAAARAGAALQVITNAEAKTARAAVSSNLIKQAPLYSRAASFEKLEHAP
jgi:hypothetical protein